MRHLSLILVLLIAQPAVASDPEADADTIQACLETGWPRNVLELCTGVIADPCQLSPGGDTTRGMERCLTREVTAWDAVLNRLWEHVMIRAREVDASNGTAERGLDSAAETQRAAQRAWITFRDAECRASYASWGEGSFRTVAHAACMLDLTARRVVDFTARLAEAG